MDNNTRFSVYKHRLVIKENLLVTRQFIVLKHADGTLEFTNFHRFIRSPVHRVRKYTDDGNSRFYFIAQFLNYVFFQCGLVKLDDITVEMVAEFLNAYGMCSLPGDHDQTRRSEKTVERCVRNVMDFLELYIAERKDKCLIKSDDLYRYVSKRDKHGKLIRVRVPVFDVYYSGSTKKIYRDIPNKAFDMIFSHIMRNHQEILGLVLLSSFAGLRPAEACNVRRPDSPLGPGILFEIVDGELIKIEIDLQKELNLRSDLKSVGKIKKERKQQVPDIFLKAFYESFKVYMKYLEGKKYEEEYGAFTVNKQGRAMTYDSYLKKFQDIIQNEIIPLFLNHNDPEIVLYGRILLEHKLSPHIFRHWYTVQLVLSGIEDPGILMHWRGDLSAESSLTYLHDKGELQKQYLKVNNEVHDYLMWAADKEYG